MPASKITLAKRVAELERQLEKLKAAVAVQESKPATAEAVPKAVAASAAAGACRIAPSPTGKDAAPIVPGQAEGAEPTKAAPVTPAPPTKAEAVSDEISPEILAVIAAAVAQFCGKSFRIRSARVVHPVGTSPWAQQGRVFIQASHNLAMTR